MPSTASGARQAVPGWAKWLIGLAIVAMLVAGLSLYYTFNPSQQEPQAGPSTPAATDTTPSPRPSGSADSGIGVVTGCFVGPQDSTQALLAAQEKAPHTTAGAVELAGQFVKWSSQFPLPTVGGAQKVDAQIVSDKADETVARLVDETEASQEAEAETYSTSFEQGYYFVLERSPDEVVVSIFGAAVREGVETPVASIYGTLTMVWEDGAWHLAAEESVQSPQQVVDSGTPFAGGC